MLSTKNKITTNKIYQRLNLTAEKLEKFCQGNDIIELSLFGSILREDFNNNSDIDLLVVFDPIQKKKMSLIDLVEIQYQLEDLTYRKIDLIEKQTIINSHNWIRRQNILNTAQIIYE